MSEINTVFNKSSKQLLSLAKTLKENNKTLEGRVVESLLVKRNVETIKKRKLKHKFNKHPDPLTSESETSIVKPQPVQYGYSESSLSFNYNKSCDISVTHSEHSVLGTNFFKYSKSPPRRHVSISPTQSLTEEQITILARNMEVEKKDAVENILLKHTNASQSTNKLKQHTVSTKIRPIANKTSSRGTTSNKSHEPTNAKRLAIQKKNVDHKLRDYLQRIMYALEDIRATMVKGIEPPDGAEDWERVKVRTSEFSSRFSRNYLYQLGREIVELQEVTKKSGGNVTNRTAKNIHQRMFSAHQIVLQAFQAYRSHMTTLIPNALAEKLQYAIEQTLILCDIHLKYLNLDQTGSSRREALINVLKNRCNILLDKIQDIIEKRGQINNAFFSPTTKLSLMGYNVNFKKSGKPKPRKKNPLEARLSMYSINSGVRTKSAYWKKTAELLAKDKLRYNHVQSRYKTAGYKHRAVAEKPTVIELPTKSKLFGKRSSCLLRNTPISTPHNEDSILTMVEMQKEKENTSCHAMKNVPPQIQQLWSHVDGNEIKNVPPDCEEQLNNHVKDLQIQDLGTRIHGLCQQVCPKDGEAMTQKQLEILLKGLLGMALDGKINTDKETGSKKNGFTLQNKELLIQKFNGEEPEKEFPEKGTTDMLKKFENENKNKVVENKKSLDLVIKHFDSNTIVSEKNDEGPEEKNNIQENELKIHKVEFDEANIINTKKIDKGWYMNKNKNKRRQTVTVTGAKNAQLICIRDEDSIIESPDVSITNEGVKEIKELPTSNTSPGDTLRNNKKIYKRGFANKAPIRMRFKQLQSARLPNVKISRLPKKLVLVPKNQVLNMIQYKLQYNKFTKGNHMYRKSSKVQPWVIVNTISDHLLNELLLSLAREIHVDHILESLYRSEFQ